MVSAALLLIGGPVAFWVLALKPVYEHRRWFDQVQSDLQALADKRPADVSPGQWQFMVDWTFNLHGNCGASHNWVDRQEKWRFLADLERRLQGQVNIATIDWIWDEYARISKYGHGYGEKYRPTRSPDLQHIR